MKVVLVVLVVKATICVTGAVCQHRARLSEECPGHHCGTESSITRDVVVVVTLLVLGYWLQVITNNNK